MTQEEIDFQFFEQNQLLNIDFNTGIIDVVQKNKKPGSLRPIYNVGSLSHDGYQRIWCNRRLRMKHRLIFWLYHHYLPEEVDHIDHNRNNNSITNLRASDRSSNTKGNHFSKFKRLTKQTVHELCKDIASNQYTITDLANKYGRSRVHIKGIMLKKYWKEISDLYF